MYLEHYGVLGMKWGVRRAKKFAQKAKAAEAKGQIDKAKKFQSKSQKIESYHKFMAGTKAYDYSKSQSLGKSLVKSLAFGTHGALKYNQARTAGASRGKAVLDGLLYNMANVATSGLVGIVEPRMNR